MHAVTAPRARADPPVAGPHSAAEVLEQVRLRGWSDSLWAEVGRLRREEDAVRIFQAFSAAGALRFPGDVLRALLQQTPYPVPANRAQEPEVEARLPAGGEEGPVRANVHPGPATCFAVTGLPEPLRRFECTTDWRERPEFERRPPAAQLALLDQISLGSVSLREPAALSGDALFPPPFDVEAVPWSALAELARTFPAERGVGLEILRDWGSILRSALSQLEPRVLAEAQPSRSALAQAYERATLRWMVQRLAFERLAAP